MKVKRFYAGDTASDVSGDGSGAVGSAVGGGTGPGSGGSGPGDTGAGANGPSGENRTINPDQGTEDDAQPVYTFDDFNALPATLRAMPSYQPIRYTPTYDRFGSGIASLFGRGYSGLFTPAGGTTSADVNLSPDQWAQWGTLDPRNQGPYADIATIWNNPAYDAGQKANLINSYMASNRLTPESIASFLGISAQDIRTRLGLSQLTAPPAPTAPPGGWDVIFGGGRGTAPPPPAPGVAPPPPGVAPPPPAVVPPPAPGTPITRPPAPAPAPAVAIPSVDAIVQAYKDYFARVPGATEAGFLALPNMNLVPRSTLYEARERLLAEQAGVTRPPTPAPAPVTAPAPAPATTTGIAGLQTGTVRNVGGTADPTLVPQLTSVYSRLGPNAFVDRNFRAGNPEDQAFLNQYWADRDAQYAAQEAALTPGERQNRALEEIRRTATTDREARDRIFALSPEIYKRLYYTLPAERMIPEGGFQNTPETAYWRAYTAQTGLSPTNDAAYRAWLQTPAGRAAATGMQDIVGNPTLADFDANVQRMITAAASPTTGAAAPAPVAAPAPAPVAAPAPASAVNQPLYNFVASNLDNPQAVYGQMVSYGMNPDTLASALGISSDQVRAYFDAAGINTSGYESTGA